MGLSARPGIIAFFAPGLQHIYHIDALGYLNDSICYCPFTRHRRARPALRPGVRLRKGNRRDATTMPDGAIHVFRIAR